MELNKLEKVLLAEFMSVYKIFVSKTELNEKFEVESRTYTGSGCYTEFYESEQSKIFSNDETFIWDDIGAFLNKEKIDTGYVFYVKNGFLTTIEGFSYDQVWPKRIDEIEIYKLNDLNENSQ